MQPSGVLHEGAFPGHRQGKEEGIGPGVVESFHDISACCQQQTLLICGNGGKLFFNFSYSL